MAMSAGVNGSKVLYFGGCDHGVLLLNGLLPSLHVTSLAIVVLKDPVEVAVVIATVATLHPQEADLLPAGEAMSLVHLLGDRGLYFWDLDSGFLIDVVLLLLMLSEWEEGYL